MQYTLRHSFLSWFQLRLVTSRASQISSTCLRLCAFRRLNLLSGGSVVSKLSQSTFSSKSSSGKSGKEKKRKHSVEAKVVRRLAPAAPLFPPPAFAAFEFDASDPSATEASSSIVNTKGSSEEYNDSLTFCAESPLFTQPADASSLSWREPRRCQHLVPSGVERLPLPRASRRPEGGPSVQSDAFNRALPTQAPHQFQQTEFASTPVLHRRCSACSATPAALDSPANASFSETSSSQAHRKLLEHWRREAASLQNRKFSLSHGRRTSFAGGSSGTGEGLARRRSVDVLQRHPNQQRRVRVCADVHASARFEESPSEHDCDEWNLDSQHKRPERSCRDQPLKCISPRTPSATVHLLRRHFDCGPGRIRSFKKSLRSHSRRLQKRRRMHRKTLESSVSPSSSTPHAARLLEGLDGSSFGAQGLAQVGLLERRHQTALWGEGVDGACASQLAALKTLSLPLSPPFSRELSTAGWSAASGESENGEGPSDAESQSADATLSVLERPRRRWKSVFPLRLRLLRSEFQHSAPFGGNFWRGGTAGKTQGRGVCSNCGLDEGSPPRRSSAAAPALISREGESHREWPNSEWSVKASSTLPLGVSASGASRTACISRSWISPCEARSLSSGASVAPSLLLRMFRLVVTAKVQIVCGGELRQLHNAAEVLVFGSDLFGELFEFHEMQQQWLSGDSEGIRFSFGNPPRDFSDKGWNANRRLAIADGATPLPREAEALSVDDLRLNRRGGVCEGPGVALNGSHLNLQREPLLDESGRHSNLPTTELNVTHSVSDFNASDPRPAAAASWRTSAEHRGAWSFAGDEEETPSEKWRSQEGWPETPQGLRGLDDRALPPAAASQGSSGAAELPSTPQFSASDRRRPSGRSFQHVPPASRDERLALDSPEETSRGAVAALQSGEEGREGLRSDAADCTPRAAAAGRGGELQVDSLSRGKASLYSDLLRQIESQRRALELHREKLGESKLAERRRSSLSKGSTLMRPYVPSHGGSSVAIAATRGGSSSSSSSQYFSLPTAAAAFVGASEEDVVAPTNRHGTEGETGSSLYLRKAEQPHGLFFPTDSLQTDNSFPPSNATQSFPSQNALSANAYSLASNARNNLDDEEKLEGADSDGWRVCSQPGSSGGEQPRAFGSSPAEVLPAPSLGESRWNSPTTDRRSGRLRRGSFATRSDAAGSGRLMRVVESNNSSQAYRLFSASPNHGQSPTEINKQRVRSFEVASKGKIKVAAEKVLRRSFFGMHRARLALS